MKPTNQQKCFSSPKMNSKLNFTKTTSGKKFLTMEKCLLKLFWNFAHLPTNKNFSHSTKSRVVSHVFDACNIAMQIITFFFFWEKKTCRESRHKSHSVVEAFDFSISKFCHQSCLLKSWVSGARLIRHKKSSSSTSQTQLLNIFAIMMAEFERFNTRALYWQKNSKDYQNSFCSNDQTNSSLAEIGLSRW